MPETADSIAVGKPVEIGQIERELKKLWEQGGEAMARASLVNLAVYSEAPDSLRANTQLIAQITENHACRAIVIAATPSAAQDQVEAWISAHCHVSRAGSKHVCSEQISFALGGSRARLLPNIVFSHLDSDLPFYLWWQGEFHDPMDAQLWTWVDRLLFDSQEWTDFDLQMRLLEGTRRESHDRIVLCDLNWTRLIHTRFALAQFFDHSTCLARLTEIDRIEIDYEATHRSTALLLLGWLTAQLGWVPDHASKGEQFQLTDSRGRFITVAFQAKAGDPIGRCSIFCDDAEFRVVNPPDTDLLEISHHVAGKERMHELMPASGIDPVALMGQELMRGGPHQVYLRAVEAVRTWL